MQISFTKGFLEKESRSRTLLVSLLLVLGTMLLYWPVWNFEFVNYDDPEYVSENLHIQKGLTKEGIHWAIFNIHGEKTYWHPLTWISHMVDCQLFGIRPGPHHIVNVGIHTVNALLLFLLLKSVTGAFWRSAMVAGLFALHPLQVGTVAWVAERKNVLSGLCFMLILLSYWRYVCRPGLFRYALVFALLCAGLMTKPVLVVVPPLLLVLDCWPLRRLKTGIADQRKQETSPTSATSGIVRLSLEKLPLLVPVLISSYITIAAHYDLGSLDSSERISFLKRLANLFVSYLRYVEKIFWPAKLAVFYPHPGSWPLAIVISSVLFFIAISLVAYLTFRRWPFFLAGWLWFLGVLFPAMGIVQAGSQAMADRFCYLAIIGIFVAIVWVGVEIGRNHRQVTVLCAVILLFLAGFQSSRQLSHWKNSVTLFEHALVVTDRNALAHNNLGAALRNQNKFSEAKSHFQSAIAIDPKSSEAFLNLGGVLLEERNTNQAMICFEKSVEADPGYYLAHNDLANLLFAKGEIAPAEVHYQAAIKCRPDYAEAHYNLAILLTKNNQPDSAKSHYLEAIRLQPDFTRAHNNLGKLLFDQGQPDQAELQFREVVRLNPTEAEAYFMSGLCQSMQKKKANALVSFREAVRLRPDWPLAMNELAWILATGPENISNGNEAVHLAERACQLTGNERPEFLGTLDAAYAAAGRFDQAIITAEKARAIFLGRNENELAQQAEARLALYRMGKRFVDY